MTIVVDNVPLGLYIHLPWCVRKCPYCDFNSHERTTELDFDKYIACLLEDLRTSTNAIGPRAINTIFIGGGTPSLFPAKAIQRLMDGIRETVTCDSGMEVTLEANPGAADVARFAGYLDAGVNRLSIGVQSFRDRQLKLLGRVHCAQDARDAYFAARQVGFANINIDIMHGLPEDNVEAGLFDLQCAVDLHPEHISWYQLTIESGTAFARKPPPLPSHDDIGAIYGQGRELLESAGYQQYEVSAYAKPNRQSRHNINYWEFGDYLGIGAGAHGKVTTENGVFRAQKRSSPVSYMAQVGGADGTAMAGPVDDNALVSEFAINVFRLRRGFRENLFSERTGVRASLLESPLAEAARRGWLIRDGGIVRPSELGFRFLSDVQLLFL